MPQTQLQGGFSMSRIVAVLATAAAAAAAFAPPLTPSSREVRNVVFTLVRAEKHGDLGVYQERVRCMRRVLAGGPLYDEVVFHDGNISDELRFRISAMSPGLQLVDVRQYGGFQMSLSSSAIEVDQLTDSQIGYRHMCRFMSMLWFEALANYDFAMRVDEDVCLQKLDTNPFEAMQNQGLVYAYGLETEELHMETLATLPGWLDSYAAREGLPPAGSEVHRIYFTNFFVSSVSWWRQPAVGAFLHDVDASGNIYRHRWGDAPLQSIALRLFAPASSVARLPTDYLHLSTMDLVRADGTQSPLWLDPVAAQHPIRRAYARRLAAQQNASTPFLSASRLPQLNASQVFQLNASQFPQLNASYSTHLSFSSSTGFDADEHTNNSIHGRTGFHLGGASPEVRFPSVMAGNATNATNSTNATVGSLSDYFVTVRFLCAGSVDDFENAVDGVSRQAQIGNAFAQAAEVPASDVFVDVTAASVLVQVSILLPSHAEADTVSAYLSQVLSNTSASTSFLSSRGVDGVMVETAPEVEVFYGQLPPPPPPPPLPSTPPPPPPPMLPPSVPNPPADAPAYKDDAERSVSGEAVFTLTLSLLSLLVLAVLLVRLSLLKSIEWGPVRKQALGSAGLSWGVFISRHRLVAIVCAVVFFLGATFGVFTAKLAKGSTLEWSPRGSQMAQQIKWMDQYFDDSIFSFTQIYIMVGSEKGENLLDDPKKWLYSFEKVLRRAKAVTTVNATDKYGVTRTLGWDEVCYSVDHPLLTFLAEGVEYPCAASSLLDGFQEGIWHFERLVANGDFETATQVGEISCAVDPTFCGSLINTPELPSFKNMSNAQILDVIAAGPKPWLARIDAPLQTMIGGLEVDDDGMPTHAELFVMNALQGVPNEVVKLRKSMLNFTAEQFQEANEEWMLEMEAQLKIMNDDEEEFAGVAVSFYPSNAIDRMYAEIAGGQVQSIVIGYVTMLVFLMVTQLRGKRHENLSLIAAIGFFCVILENGAAYGLIALFGIAYNHTMLQALPFLALGLGVDDLFLLLHHLRSAMAQAHTTRCTDHSFILGQVMMEAGASVTITSFCNAAVFMACCIIIPIPALQDFLLSAAIVVMMNWLGAVTLLPALFSFKVEVDIAATPSWRASETVDDAAAAPNGAHAALQSSPEHNAATGTIYAKLAKSRPLKVVCLLLGVGVAAGTISLIPKVDMGYEMTDLAKEGTFLALGIHDMWTHVYAQYAKEFVAFAPGTDYPNVQKQILATQAELGESEWTLGPVNMWMTNMYVSAGVCEDYNITGDGTLPAHQFYREFHKYRQPSVFVPGTSTIALGSLEAILAYFTNSFAYEKGPDNYDEDNELIFSYNIAQIDMRRVRSTDDKVQMAKDLKRILQSQGLNMFMYGFNFVQIEQFMSIEYHFWCCISVSMVVVFGISLACGISVLGAYLVSILSATLGLELYGCIYLLGISFQPLVATTMLMSVGIAVEFVAHPVAAYEFAKGSGNQRLALSLQSTALPVVFGAISSFVGFVLLAFSEFEYVRNYFFWIFFMIIILGCVNGLVLLPAILGLVGPSKDKDKFRRAASQRKLDIRNSQEPPMLPSRQQPPPPPPPPLPPVQPNQVSPNNVQLQIQQQLATVGPSQTRPIARSGDMLIC